MSSKIEKNFKILQKPKYAPVKIPLNAIHNLLVISKEKILLGGLTSTSPQSMVLELVGDNLMEPHLGSEVLCDSRFLLPKSLIECLLSKVLEPGDGVGFALGYKILSLGFPAQNHPSVKYKLNHPQKSHLRILHPPDWFVLPGEFCLRL